MRKFYIAARGERQQDARDAAARIEIELGHLCTAQWLKVPDIRSHDGKPKILLGEAVRDLEDILISDYVVCLSESSTTPTLRGGRHVEFGYALAKGLPLIIIGPRENVFHFLPERYKITQFDNLEAFLQSERTAYGNVTWPLVGPNCSDSGLSSARLDRKT